MAKLAILTATMVAAGATVLAAAPVAAVVTTFAQYTAAGRGADVYWNNNGTGGTVGQNAISGSGGSLFTIDSSTSTTPGSREVLFSFLQPGLASVTDVAALFTLNATVSNSPATLVNGVQAQSGITGSFSFLSTTPITIGSVTYEAGANLLSATFTQGVISGARLANVGTFAPGTVTSITYTSDFMNFTAPSSHDFSLSLTSITGALQAIPAIGASDRALRTFRASSTGLFSTDLSLAGVPEPATWGLMIVGFGMVGVQARRRAALA